MFEAWRAQTKMNSGERNEFRREGADENESRRRGKQFPNRRLVGSRGFKINVRRDGAKRATSNYSKLSGEHC